MKENRIKEFLVGSDPELFLREKESGNIVSAIPFIPGDKHNPYQIPDLKEGCMIQTDNIMVEYCIPASNDPKVFYEDIRKCMEYTNLIVPQSLEVVVESSARIQREYLKDKRTQVFGCDPDYNVWSGGEQNESPSNKTNLRTCGGHVHIGYNDPDMETSMNIIKALDIYLGIPSVILDPDRERKKMYGKAGAYRLKHYGVEYRSLSNFWIKEQESVEFVFNAIKAAIDFLNNNGLERIDDTLALKIQTCINTGEESLAYELLAPLHLEGLLNKSKIYID